MADNTTLDPGTGGDTIALDDIGGVKYQRVKLVEGADGVNDGDISSSNPLPVDASGNAVSLTGSMSVFISSGTVSVNLNAGTNTNEIVGDAAHGAAVAGNPVLRGGEARITNPTAVDDGDVVRPMHDDLGKQIVVLHGPRDLIVDNHSSSLTLSTTLTFLPAGGASVFRDLTMITISNPSATPALVTIYDRLTGGAARFAWEFAADGGGIALAFTTPFKQATANNGWAITSSEIGVKFTVQAVENI